MASKNPKFLKEVCDRCPKDGKRMFKEKCNKCKYEGQTVISDIPEKPFRFSVRCLYDK